MRAWYLAAACLAACAHLLLLLPAAGQEARVSYQGAQLLRLAVLSEEDRRLVEALEGDGDVQIWSGLHQNGSEVDALALPGSAERVKELLESSNVTYSVVIEDLEDAIRSENPVPSEEEMQELEGRKGHRMTWYSYHRMAEVHGYLEYLAQTYPKLCSVQAIGTSGQGRPLKVLKISSGKPNSRAIWVDGGIHAREWISPAVVTYIINELVENYESHSDAVQAVDWYILPIVNPDGYEYTHTTNRLWRKNRRSNADSRCMGVDLNRNFGYKWGGKGSSRDPCTEIYAGQYGFSEPETSAISGFLTPKIGTVKAYVTFHSYGQYFLYPWGYDRVLPPDYKELDRVARKATQAMQAAGSYYTAGSSATTLYPASGGSDDWAKGVAKVKYAYTIELRDKGRYGFILPANYIIPTAKEGLAAIKIIAQEVARLK
ncbi:carboxypeptidase B-like [Bacillus rossius redtenbacheri]|uniref:carboxypeptidase B-like n=1 Tax=Bacillus rossius redtenbacheri TaxID=93214 RepID=UPI002FDE30A5